MSTAIQFASEVRKSQAADQPNATTVLASSTDLQVAIGPNQTWVFEFVVFLTNSAGAGAKLTVVGPAGSAGTISNNLEGSTSNAGYFALGTSLGYAAPAGSNLFKMTATIRNGATPGVAALQVAQGAADATSTVLKQDSFMVGRRTA